LYTIYTYIYIMCVCVYIYICQRYSIPWVWNSYSIPKPTRRARSVIFGASDGRTTPPLVPASGFFPDPPTWIACTLLVFPHAERGFLLFFFATVDNRSKFLKTLVDGGCFICVKIRTNFGVHFKINKLMACSSLPVWAHQF
jgi:hypothetical protein